jgi:hypothetical protein
MDMYFSICRVLMKDGHYSVIISAKREEYLNSVFKPGMLSEYNTFMKRTELIQYFSL